MFSSNIFIQDLEPNDDDIISAILGFDEDIRSQDEIFPASGTNITIRQNNFMSSQRNQHYYMDIQKLFVFIQVDRGVGLLTYTEVSLIWLVYLTDVSLCIKLSIAVTVHYSFNCK